MGLVERPKFWYVTNKEYEKIREFYDRHLHLGEEIYRGTISRVPYHLEIIPNSVSYTVKIICDICEKKSVTDFPDIEFEMDVTDYDDW